MCVFFILKLELPQNRWIYRYENQGVKFSIGKVKSGVEAGPVSDGPDS